MRRLLPIVVFTVALVSVLSETCPCAYWFKGKTLGGIPPTSYSVICHSNGINHNTGWYWTNIVPLCPQGDEVKWSWENGGPPCNGSTNNLAGTFTADNACTNCTGHTYSVYMGSNIRGDGVIVTTNGCKIGTNCVATMGFQEVLADQYNCGGERPLMEKKKTLVITEAAIAR